jgi:hypothetical protein
MRLRKKKKWIGKMINYSIDASVYAFQGDTCDVTEIEKYYDIIDKLDKLITKHPHYRKFYLFEEDMKLIRKYYLMYFTEENISRLDKILKSNGSRRNMGWARLLTENIISKMDNKKKEYIMFEKWFNIEDVKFKDGNYPPLPKEINEKINNKELIKNTKRNIAKIAYLNEYVYKSDQIHNIILNDCIETKSIPPMTNVEFDIKMIDNYIIKNAPLKVINSLKQKVNISKLDALTKNNFIYNEWEEALNAAKEHFKDHLVFVDPGVEASLEEYLSIIKKESKKLFGAKNQEFSKWMEEGPNALYENLKALDDFLVNINLKPAPKNKDERYHCCKNKCEGKACWEDRDKNFTCKGKCEFLEVCGSNIRYFGVDCVDELWKHRKDKDVEKDRTRKNSEGGESIYWIHLRPQRITNEAALGFLSLRIYFRPLGAGKIEIGWIGKHL